MAQKQKINYYEKIDRCDWLVTYEFIRIDSVLNSMQSNDMVLQIGSSYHKFYDEHLYQYDREVWLNDNLMNPEDAQKLLFAKLPSYFDYLRRNMLDKTFTLEGFFVSYFYKVVDSTAVQQWNLEYTDTINVCGYLCRKATCTFRGRNWTAWYAPDLNMDAGPWKLHGLPGLILKAEESEALILYQATNVQKGSDYPIEREEEDSNIPVISREKYLELERMDALQPNEFQALITPSLQPDTSDSLIPRQFYCPLEKE